MDSVGSLSAELRPLPVASEVADCCRERCREDRPRRPEPSDASDGLGGIAGRPSCTDSGGIW